MVWLLVLVLIVWALTHFYLRGEDLSAYDTPKPASMSGNAPASEGLLEVEAMLAGLTAEGKGVRDLAASRARLDDFGDGVEFDGEIIAVDSNGLHGEWLIPPGADESVRTLYIHGGAFMMGSPKSHRTITTEYARITGGVVFSLNYRLMPENPRQAGIDDCRFAYRWLLENAPSGHREADTVYISGDSAGGSLALSLSRWASKSNVRDPDAVVALSPATDSGFSSPSVRKNIPTDKMLGSAFGKLARVPAWILLWAAWFTNRTSPATQSVSPVMGDLSGLPPTLVHASEVEMLMDDACRYVNKARASGSPVTLQTWNHAMHVWHMFHPSVPEAQEAMLEISQFLQRHKNSTRIKKAA